MGTAGEPRTRSGCRRGREEEVGGALRFCSAHTVCAHAVPASLHDTTWGHGAVAVFLQAQAQLLRSQLEEAQSRLADRDRQVGALSRQSSDAESTAQQAKRVETQVGRLLNPRKHTGCSCLQD